MAMKFYRKLSPDVPVPIELSGQPSGIRFPSLDGSVGWFSTDNANLQAALQKQIELGRSGLSEVPWDFFNDEYVKKKQASQPLRRVWREELSLSGLKRAATGKAPLENPVAVVTDVSGTRMEDLPPSSAQPTAEGEPAPVTTGFTPTVGKRVIPAQ